MLVMLAFIALFGRPEGTGITVLIEGSPPLPGLQQLDAGPAAAADSSIGLLQERLLQWYLEEGYPFASAGFYFTAAETLVVNAVPGRRAMLEEVRVEGMPGTDPKVFTRLLSIRPGEPYSREAVSAWTERLQRLKFVSSAGPAELLLGPMGNLVLVQNLQKGSAGHFAASMDWRGEYLEGMGEILFLNLAGTARELEISGQTTEWGGLNARIRYREPWLFGIPLSLQMEFSQDTPESSWVNREAVLSAIWSMDRVEITAGAGAWRGYPPDGSRQKYDFGLAGIGYRSGRHVPQGFQGIDLELEARSGNMSGGDSPGLLTMAGMNARMDLYSGFLGFGGRVLAGGVMQGNWFEGLLIQLGGQATLRGYPEAAFRAVRYVVLRPELSIGETATRIYLFYDIAAVETMYEGMRYPSGCGGGIRGRSGIFNADAAVGFPVLEGPGSARLYLRLSASM